MSSTVILYLLSTFESWLILTKSNIYINDFSFLNISIKIVSFYSLLSKSLFELINVLSTNSSPFINSLN